MKIIANTIIVKSNPAHYEKESTGYKNNTCRTLKSITEDGLTIEDMQACTSIIVRNSETERQIEREISDISVFEDIVIISWFSM